MVTSCPFQSAGTFCLVLARALRLSRGLIIKCSYLKRVGWQEAGHLYVRFSPV